MRFDAQKLATGSCFFWGHNDKTYLVTNWHNFSGRNHLTNELLSSNSAIPDRFAFWAFKKISEPNADGIYEINSEPIEVALYRGDPPTPLWFEHPTLGKRVDVAAIDITSYIQDYEVTTVNSLESDALIDSKVSQDVFVIGFPFGLMANAPVPIWKRGTVAIDPTFNPDGLPKMLIDTATRVGMSGSVVLARHIVANSRYNKRDGNISIIPVAYAELDVVIGIYSGRHYPDYDKAQLGIVWKRSTIEETVMHEKLTDYRPF